MNFSFSLTEASSVEYEREIHRYTTIIQGKNLVNR